MKKEMRRNYQKTLITKVENVAKKDVYNNIKKKLQREVL